MKALQTISNRLKLDAFHKIVDDGIIQHRGADLYKYDKNYQLINESHISEISHKLAKGIGYDSGQIALIIEAMIEEKWTIERFKDALTNALKSEKFPNTAKILSYANNIIFYTYQEVLTSVNNGKYQFNAYEGVKIKGISNIGEKHHELPYWVLKASNQRPNGKRIFQLWDNYLTLRGEPVV